MLEDEKYQRDAFAAQLIKQDSRHKQICQQVEQIQNELASLTMVEMTKRDLQVSPEPEVAKLTPEPPFQAYNLFWGGEFPALINPSQQSIFAVNCSTGCNFHPN